VRPLARIAAHSHTEEAKLAREALAGTAHQQVQAQSQDDDERYLAVLHLRQCTARVLARKQDTHDGTRGRSTQTREESLAGASNESPLARDGGVQSLVVTTGASLHGSIDMLTRRQRARKALIAGVAWLIEKIPS